MNNQEYFIKVPVETLPEESGEYVIVDSRERLWMSYYDDEERGFDHADVTHYLKPVSSLDIQKEREDILSKVELLDQKLSYIEDIAKGNIGDLVTEVRGISTELYQMLLNKSLTNKIE